MKQLRDKGIFVIIYEPGVSADTYESFPVEHDLSVFKKKCDLILANRFSKDLTDCQQKVYTRDLNHIWNRKS